MSGKISDTLQCTNSVSGKMSDTVYKNVVVAEIISAQVDLYTFCSRKNFVSGRKKEFKYDTEIV